MGRFIYVKRLPSEIEDIAVARQRGVYPLKNVICRLKKPSYPDLCLYLKILAERQHDTREICGIWRDPENLERYLVDIQPFFKWLRSQGYWEAPEPLFPEPVLREETKGSLEQELIKMMPLEQYRASIYPRVLAKLRALCKEPDGEKLLIKVGVSRVYRGTRLSWLVVDPPLLEAWCHRSGVLNYRKILRGRPPSK